MNIALITAGGYGKRMGEHDFPKQFKTIDGKPIIIYTLEAFQNHSEIDAIAVVCLHGWEAVLRAYANQFKIAKLKWIFGGAENNQQSIHNGISGLKNSGCSDNDIILIHDGVRPLVSQDIISNNIKACTEYGYAVTGIVCEETIMEKVGDNVQAFAIPHEKLIRTQTPHTYRLGTLLDAHKKAKEKGIANTVSSCVLFSSLGVKDQHFVQGNERNGLKLTFSQDMELLRALIH